MEEYQQFVKRLLINYIMCSLLAVFGIGGIPMLISLNLDHRDVLFLMIILGCSLLVMFVVEGFYFWHHLKPIKRAFTSNFKNKDINEAAFTRLFRFPELTARRIMLPHLWGFSLPAIFLSLWLIHVKLLTFPFSYVFYAMLASVIVALMHALIEYFLTVRTIQPAIEYMNGKIHGESEVFLHNRRIRVTIKSKLGVAIVLIGVFPVVLFLLAAQVKIQQMTGISTLVFWKWAGIVLLITVFYSLLISRIMAKDIEKPILQLQKMMKEVESRNYLLKENVYTDEFSDLFNGFNRMIFEIKKHNEKNEMMLESFLMVLSAALDARDPYTSGHSVRVADYSRQIGLALCLQKESIDLLYKTALLHDIGKIGVPDRILLKEGRLSDEEFSLIKAHPAIGENILKQVYPISEIAEFLPGVRSHHERMDGKGYPDALSGEKIPLFGRIIAVADAYDAMTSDRPYRKGMQAEKALNILNDGRGTQWDTHIVDKFIGVVIEPKINENAS